MQFEIEHAQLMHLIQSPSRVVEKRNTIPILGHIKFQVSGGCLSVTATDLNLSATATDTIAGAKDGTCTVPAAQFVDYVKRLDKGKVITVATSDGTVTVKSGRSRTKFNTLEADTFPKIASDEYSHSFTLDAGEMLDALSSTKGCMSTEETRHYLNGVYMHQTDNGLTFVATDGHRLARMVIPGEFETTGVIIPTKAVAEVIGALSDLDEAITVETSETKLRVSCGDFEIVSKVVDGTYPDYTRVIPVGNDISMTVDAKEFRDATARVTVVTADRSKRIDLDVSDGECQIEVTEPVVGVSTDVVAAESTGTISASYNSKYLAEMMAIAQGGSVTMKFKGKMDPALVLMDDIPEFTGVCMPMRGK